jgi:general secretion pathway protein D
MAAPKLTVLSGEAASMQVMTDTVIALPPDVGSQVFPGGISGTGAEQFILPNFEILQTGTTLSITPIISPDKKHVLLNIMVTLNDFLGLKTYNLETPLPDGGVQEYKQELPETEMSQVMTRVSVPDGATLLLGGQKVTAEVEREAGVPVMAKLPIIGRLFSNRSKIKDQKILLILVKPTIILQEERDAEAIAAMEEVF